MNFGDGFDTFGDFGDGPAAKGTTFNDVFLFFAPPTQSQVSFFGSADRSSNGSTTFKFTGFDFGVLNYELTDADFNVVGINGTSLALDNASFTRQAFVGQSHDFLGSGIYYLEVRASLPLRTAASAAASSRPRSPNPPTWHCCWPASAWSERWRAVASSRPDAHRWPGCGRASSWHPRHPSTHAWIAALTVATALRCVCGPSNGEPRACFIVASPMRYDAISAARSSASRPRSRRDERQHELGVEAGRHAFLRGGAARGAQQDAQRVELRLAALLAAVHHQRGDHLAELRHVEAVEVVLDGEGVVDGLVEQLLLAAEVAVDQRGVHAGVGGDVAGADVLVGVDREAHAGGGQDAGTGIAGVAGGLAGASATAGSVFWREVIGAAPWRSGDFVITW